MPSPAPVTLESAAVRIVCSPAQGFSIDSLIDRASGADALWRRPGHVVAPCSRRLGPAGVASEETFLELFSGGWFEMFPEVGYTQPGDGASFVHGEVVRLPWELLEQGSHHVCARVATVRRPLELRRTLTLDGAVLHVAERVLNTGLVPVPYSWGHHPCFSRATFAGGAIELGVAAAAVPDPWFDPEHALLAHGSFAWPHARSRATASAGGAVPGGGAGGGGADYPTSGGGGTGDAASGSGAGGGGGADYPTSGSRAGGGGANDAASGGGAGGGGADYATSGGGAGGGGGGASVDLSSIPAQADGRSDHACLRLSDGALRLTAPAHGRALRIDFDHARFPYALLWQDFGAGEGYPFWGGADTFAVEFSTIPGRSTPDAIAAGALSTLLPGESAETAFSIAWEALDAA